MVNKILMIGIGNNGRSDDALGWKFVEEFNSQDDLLDIEFRYQLQIEDALLISEYKKVILVDASRKQYQNGFSFYKCVPTHTESFTTHMLEPETLLWLTNDLFNQSPEVFVMAISGIEWELNQGLSVKAEDNFKSALSYFNKLLSDKFMTFSV